MILTRIHLRIEVTNHTGASQLIILVDIVRFSVHTFVFGLSPYLNKSMKENDLCDGDIH